jgi:hypothetical protein
VLAQVSYEAEVDKMYDEHPKEGIYLAGDFRLF